MDSDESIFSMGEESDGFVPETVSNIPSAYFSFIGHSILHNECLFASYCLTHSVVSPHRIFLLLIKHLLKPKTSLYLQTQSDSLVVEGKTKSRPKESCCAACPKENGAKYS